MLSLLLVLVAFVFSVLYGMFLAPDFSVTLSDGSVVENAGAVESFEIVFEDALDTIASSDLLGFFAWLFPISGMYLLTECFFVLVVVYSVVSTLWPFLREWLANRTS